MEERGSVACCQRVPWRIHNHWVCEADFLRRHISHVGSVGRHFDLVTNLPLCEQSAKFRIEPPEEIEVLPQKIVGHNQTVGAGLKSRQNCERIILSDLNQHMKTISYRLFSIWRIYTLSSR